MKKANKIELKIYELLGIKKFKHFLTKYMRKILSVILNLNEYSKNLNLNSTDFKNNYLISNDNGIKGVSDFKKMLVANYSIHILASILTIPLVIAIINGTATISNYISLSMCTLINIYCLMLQRYNWIRIKHVCDKHKDYDKKKTAQLKQNIKSLNYKLQKTTVIVHIPNEEKFIDIDDFIETADIYELRQVQKELEKIKGNNQEENFLFVRKSAKTKTKNHKPKIKQK